MSLFVSFHGDLGSKWAMGVLRKKYPVDKYTKESNGIALFLLQIGLIWRKKLKICFVKSEKTL